MKTSCKVVSAQSVRGVSFMRMLLLSMFLGIAASLSAQTIYQKEDKFAGSVKYFTADLDTDLEGGSFWSGRYVHLSLAAYKPIPESKEPYDLIVRTQTEGWAFIESGASLLLKLDGKLMELSGAGSLNHREVFSGRIVTEAARYPLTTAQLLAIGKAKKIEFRVLGSKQTMTGELKPEGVEAVAFFAKRAPKMVEDPAVPKDEKEGDPDNQPKLPTKEEVVENLNKEFREAKLDAVWSQEGDNLVATMDFAIMAETRTENVRNGFAQKKTLLDRYKQSGFKKVIFRSKSSTRNYEIGLE